MKTREQIRADREARAIASVTGPRTGFIHEASEEMPVPSPVVQGLKLSEILFWPLSRFKPHPKNEVFDSAKTQTYWRDLKRDILESGAIINPVIVLPDGTLMEGHSRIRIARELAEEGHDLGPIPVRVVGSSITDEEAERRVYLGNLSRFELDENTRLSLYAKIWPGYFLEKKRPGKRALGNGATVALIPPTLADVAAATGKSPRQVKYDKAIVKAAAERAKIKGKFAPDPEDISKARAEAASKRREKRPRAITPAAPGRVALHLPRAHVELVLRMLRRVKAPSTAQTKIMREIEKALKQ